MRALQRTDATGDGDGDGAAVGSGRIKPMATTRAFPRYEPYGAGTGTQHAGKERQHSEMNSEDEDAMYYHTMEMFKSSYRSSSGNAKSHKSALKLVELGPRIRMKLSKVERGLAGGDVMYHAYVKKDAAEAKAQKEKIQQEAGLKKRRREEQEENVRRKKAVLREKLEKKRQKQEAREVAAMRELRGSAGGGDDDGSGSDGNANDDDQSSDGSEE